MSQPKSRSDANPGAAKASLSRAVSLHMEGKLKEALEEINRVLEAGDETPEAFSFLTEAIEREQIACGVTWTNADDTPHNVREKDGKFKSAALDTDDTFSQTFSAPGEYEYFCSIHPRMVGTIVVQ